MAWSLREDAENPNDPSAAGIAQSSRNSGTPVGALPLAARPAVPWRKRVRFARRATLAVASLVVALLAVAGGVVPGVWPDGVGVYLVGDWPAPKRDPVLGGKRMADVDRFVRPEPEEVVEEWPDIPILGYTNHTDRAGLQRAHGAGFDQVIVKSALVERAAQVVDELTGEGSTDVA